MSLRTLPYTQMLSVSILMSIRVCRCLIHIHIEYTHLLDLVFTLYNFLGSHDINTHLTNGEYGHLINVLTTSTNMSMTMRTLLLIIRNDVVNEVLHLTQNKQTRSIDIVYIDCNTYM
jgi:RNA binding exosome subunit